MDRYSCLRLLSSGIVIVCIHYGIAHTQKNCVLVLKNTWFCSIQCYTQNETFLKKKEKQKRQIVYLNSGALSRGL